MGEEKVEKKNNLIMAEYEPPEPKRDFKVAAVGSGVKAMMAGFQKWGNHNEAISKQNPFNKDFDPSIARIKPGEEGYAKPVGLTKERGEKAKAHIYREIIDLVSHVNSLCVDDEEGNRYCTFKAIFDRYVKISDKVVGMLIRARKHGFIDFEGEMLWQHRDDDVRIYLLVDLDDAKSSLNIQ